MTPDVVVDIGNSRIKWGVCEGGRVTDVLRLPLHDPAAWDAALAKLPPTRYSRQWAIGSVNPPQAEMFETWVKSHGGTSVVFKKPSLLPIRLNVDEPDAVGIDRVFGAIAAKAMVPPGTPAITVDVGTAVTINLIDEDGVFQGGAIFPGPRMMARALHEYTAKLPLVEVIETPDDLRPAKQTTPAIRIGILSTLVGGVHENICSFADECDATPWVFLTGGASPLLAGYQVPAFPSMRSIPYLNLEGIRIAAEALP